MKPPSGLCNHPLRWLIGSCATLMALAPHVSGFAQTVTMTNVLVIERVGRAARSPVHSDGIEAKIVSGTWQPPVVGEQLELPGGATRTWREVTAGKDGWFSG